MVIFHLYISLPADKSSITIDIRIQWCLNEVLKYQIAHHCQGVYNYNSIVYEIQILVHYHYITIYFTSSLPFYNGYIFVIANICIIYIICIIWVKQILVHYHSIIPNYHCLFLYIKCIVAIMVMIVWENIYCEKYHISKYPNMVVISSPNIMGNKYV